MARIRIGGILLTSIPRIKCFPSIRHTIHHLHFNLYGNPCSRSVRHVIDFFLSWQRNYISSKWTSNKPCVCFIFMCLSSSPSLRVRCEPYEIVVCGKLVESISKDGFRWCPSVDENEINHIDQSLTLKKMDWLQKRRKKARPTLDSLQLITLIVHPGTSFRPFAARKFGCTAHTFS